MALTSLLSASLDFNLECTGNRHSFLGWYYHVQFTDIFNGDRYLAHQHWLILSEREILFKRSRKNVRVFSSTHSKAIKKCKQLHLLIDLQTLLLEMSYLHGVMFFTPRFVWLITICWWKRQIYILKKKKHRSFTSLHYVITCLITTVKNKVCISIYSS